MLGDFYLRAQGKWSSKGKYLFKVIGQADSRYAEQFQAAFDEFYINDMANRLEAYSR